jgi:hypothetical protein
LEISAAAEKTPGLRKRCGAVNMAAKEMVMGAGFKTLLVLSLGALAACGSKEEQREQNFAIDTNVPADADLEALPADESSATSSGELVNGATDPVANELGNETNTQ